MKVVIELTENEINHLEEAVGYSIEDEDAATDAIHTLIRLVRECL